MRFLTVFVSVALLAALPALSCGSNQAPAQPDTAPPGTAQPDETARSSADRAARLAAQTQLRNAQSAQEAYYAANGEYASTSEELRQADPRLSPRLEIAGGGAGGFEMSVVANDSSQTRFTLKKSGDRVERYDSEGAGW